LQRAEIGSASLAEYERRAWQKLHGPDRRIDMSIDRRNFFKLSALTGAVALGSRCASPEMREPDTADTIDNLKPMLDGIVPISRDERLDRIEKARKLMVENKIDAIYLEGGSDMFYFTGARWGLSERTFGAVIPARGEIGYVTPAFEEGRAREVITIGDDIRAWEEHENPYRKIAQILEDLNIANGTLGIGERVRFFQFDGIRREAAGLGCVSADPVTIECRVIKSPAELALMQRAADITIEAYKVSVAMIEKGMTRSDFANISSMAHRALGVDGRIGCQIDAASSSPHGSKYVMEVREGSTILMDGGCSVEGYRSDISRTVFFGSPGKRQIEMWNLAAKAQRVAFEAAGVGVPCEDVDAAARQVYVDNGFGPDYKLPGLPHRTGHGIGLDGHEWINLVRGNKRPMEVGMCFSNEPAVYIPGEFGVRIEDCIHITEDGAKYFSRPSPAWDMPFAD